MLEALKKLAWTWYQFLGQVEGGCLLICLAQHSGSAGGWEWTWYPILRQIISLFDAPVAGSGQTFDWGLRKIYLNLSSSQAGLEDNIEEAIQHFTPFRSDVSRVGERQTDKRS